MKKYDVTVIIPFYNNSKFIEEAIESVLYQNYPSDKIEIILINDNSTDDGAIKIKKFLNFDNIVFINKNKNEGVSKARNDGIKIAKGKYIFLLDGDDYISKNTIRSVVNFFNKNENEIDLVTYPIYMKVNDSAPKLQKKYEYFNGKTGIYELEKYPYINQTTINVAFKNNKNVWFDESIYLAEDQKFVTNIIMEKKKIGFCNDATYIYRRYGGGISQTKNHIFYCFDDIMKFNEYLVEKYLVNNILPKYIQVMILNTLEWRLKSDMLFPYHYKGKKFEKALDRIFKFLKYIDVDTIYNYDMSKNDKFYWLKKKKSLIKLIEKNGKLLLFIDGKEVDCDNKLEITFNHFKIKNDKLYIMGTVDTLLSYTNFQFSIIKNNNVTEKVNVKLFESKLSYNKSNMKLNDIQAFELTLNLNNTKEFFFNIESENNKIPIKYNFNRYIDEIKTSNLYIIECKKNKFIVKNASFTNKFKCFFRKNFQLLNKPKVLFYRLASLFYRTKKEIWLYYDFNSLDNAYYQFEHDIKMDDNIKRYYVFNSSNKELLKNISPALIDKIINFKSFKSKMLFLNSTKILSSNSSINAYCPFGHSRKQYADIVNYDFIYLQHGILHASLPLLYSKERTEIDKFIISSEFEYKNLIENYGYNKDDLVKTGMPRFDFLNLSNNPKNKIIFAPSWRIYLCNPNNINQKKDVSEINKFLSSNYYKDIYQFISSDKLSKLLIRNNIILEIKLHPYFKEYQKFFKVECPNVKMIFEDIDLSDYKMFITDFSSFQFDFIRFVRPIVYFIPDIDEFNAGLHTYKDLDLKQDDAFGENAKSADDLINIIEKTINSNFRVDNKYEKRMTNFFSYKKNSRENIYITLKDNR